MSFRPKSATVLRTTGHTWAEYAPHPALASLVSSYWTLGTGSGEHAVRTLPDACVDVTLRFDRPCRAFIAGAQRRARLWQWQGSMHLLGARLQPGAVALLGIDAGSLCDEWTPLGALLPVAGVTALERAAARAPDAQRRIAVLEAFLTEHLLNRSLDPRLSRALQKIFEARGDISIASVARQSGTHVRTLGRLFDRAVGVSPKRFARIVRLQYALRALSPRESWTRVAVELGYHDQAHFIHDVRELFGATPGQLVALAPATR